MWTRLAFVVLVAAASAVQAWKPHTEYAYKVQSRTLSAVHQVGDQYSGMLMRATLKIYATSSNKLYAKLSKPEYANVHQALPGGWGSPIPEQNLDWKKLDMTDKHFVIQLRNGVIDDIMVHPDMPKWEINMLKGIVGQLQVDARAENAINSRINQLPNDDSVNAVYKTMEDSVTGKCEVMYDISPLPEYVLQSHPQLVPKPSENPQEAQTLDIVKTTNYSNCQQRPVFSHGFGGENDWEPASSKMGQFFARSSVSRVVVTGRPSNHLIQSSVTTNKVILSPAVYNSQKGMVVSRMNLTLLSAQSSDAQQSCEEAEEATLKIKNLVYDLTHPNNQQRENNQQKENSDEETEQGRRQQQQQQQQRWNDSEEEERMQGAAAQRFRRSLKQHRKQQQQQQQQQQDDQQDSLASFESESFEDSSVSSSQEWLNPKPNMDDAPEIPFLPFFIGIKGKSIQEKIDAPQKAAEIARDVAMDMQNPQDIPKKASLAKFAILIRLAQTMSSEQLHKVTEELYTASEDSKDSKAWKVYRDAVVQAGTAPALVNLKKWIDSKKVQGKEAAELVSQIPKSALIPTKQYVHLLFKMATSEAVKSQRHLNTTAILSFADLVRKAQVDRRFAHSQYPSHTFGRMNPTQVPAVSRDYIPYLAHQLRKAVREGDSVRIQTYVRALGNVAHPKILSVLEPYLEGEKQVSDFQRLHMVVALNKLIKVNPSLSRAVLYRIYKNISETPEIRSAAVYLLMKTNPQASMLQRLAESTNNEHSKQVRSAVKTALEHAAALRHPENQQLTENAQAAVYALNNTVFGPEYSNIHLKSGKVPEMKIAFRAGFSYVGSDDYLIPKAQFAHFRKILSGLKLDSDSYGFMASSAKDFVNLISAQYQKAYPQKDQKDIESEMAQQVEGNMLFKTVMGERFFAFDNHTIERIPSALNDMIKKIAHGQKINIQKMYNKQSFTLAFPTATGLPFVYSLMNPSVASIEGKVKAEILPEPSPLEWKSAKASADLTMLYSTKTEAIMGFVTPFDSKLHTAGTEKDAQINLPVRVEADIVAPTKGSEPQQYQMRVKVQPMKPEEDTQVAILRSKAYTAQQEIMSLKPAQQKTVHVSKPQQRKIFIGKETTGVAFRLEASAEQDFFDQAEILRLAQKMDALSAIASMIEEKKIKNYEYSLTYDNSKSRAKSVYLTANYGVLDKKPESNPYGYDDSERTKSKGNNENDEDVFPENPAIPTNNSPDSPARLQQFLHRAAESMKISRAYAIDLSAQFRGEKNAVYMATLAGAKSPMEDRYAALVYLRHQHANGKQNSIAMFPSAQIPFAPIANYHQAINNKPTAYVDTKITFAEDLEKAHSQIHIKTNLQRSAEREQYVREQPISQLCQQQSGRGNNFLPACQNATLAAGHMDQYDVIVKYARLPESVKNATYKAYSIARHLGWEYHSEDLVSARNEPRKINLKVRFARNLQAANVSIHAPQMNAEFKNIRLSPIASAAVVAHPNYKPSELVSRYVSGKSYYPTCTIDKSAVNTFDNKTFTLPHEEEWYLVAQYVPKKYEQVKHSPAKQVPFIQVQTRQSPNNEKEIKIFFGREDVVEIQPRGSQQYPEIKVNNQRYEVQSGKPTEVKSKVDQRMLVRFYGLPSGTMKLVAPMYTLDMIYDTTTFVLRVGHQYRSDIRGLCGTFDGETETDFTSPKKGIARDSRLFVKSYTVTGDGNLKHENLNAQPRDFIQRNSNRRNSAAVSDAEAGRQQGSQKRSQPQSCTSYRTKVVEKEGQLCFSIRPLAVCSSHCQPSAEAQKEVDFHCIADSAAARHMARMALKGASPDVATKGGSKKMTVQVPESCKP